MLAMTPMMILLYTCIGLGVFVVIFFLLVRGAPLRLAWAKLRGKTFLLVDMDTHYINPGVKHEDSNTIKTEYSTFGKAFRTKPLEGANIALAVPDEFIMPEAELAAAVEEDNKDVNDPENYKKMKDSSTKVKLRGKLVELKEFTKGLANRVTPSLIKAAEAIARQEALAEERREWAKYGIFIVMLCFGMGIFLIFASKAGLL